jgi:polar amino acid transport system permease protein
MCRFRPVAWIFRLYISIMRGTPLMLQLMFIFFAPYYIFGIQLTMEWRLGACLVAFIMNYSAYFAEIYRSGIQSIPRGQYEAAEVLGYSKAQTFLRIVLPQVFKRIIPALGNEIIVLVKDTSLAFTIGVAEMFTTARAIVSSQGALTAFVVAAAIYWIFTFVVEFIISRVEKKLSYYHD